MKELLKTVKKAAPAKQEKKAATKKVAAKQTFVPEKGAPYRLLSADHKWFSAYTIAAFIHTGMIGLSKAGSPTARKTGDAELWAKIVGSTAAPYWAKVGRVEGGAVTLKGLTEIGNRLKGETRYPTDREHVDKMVALLAQGGEVKVKDNVVQFKLKS